MSKGRLAPSVPVRPYHLRDIRDPSFAAGYLNAAAEDGHPEVFMIALRDVVDANGGIGAVAKRSGLGRQQLYKTLSRKGNPEFKTLRALLQAVGLAIAVAPQAGNAKRRRKASSRGKDLVNARDTAQVERPRAP